MVSNMLKCTVSYKSLWLLLDIPELKSEKLQLKLKSESELLNHKKLSESMEEKSEN
jgi:hypothetical protein